MRTYTCDNCDTKLHEGLLAESVEPNNPTKTRFRHFCNSTCLTSGIDLTSLDKYDGQYGGPADPRSSAIASLTVKWTKYNQ